MNEQNQALDPMLLSESGCCCYLLPPPNISGKDTEIDTITMHMCAVIKNLQFHRRYTTFKL